MVVLHPPHATQTCGLCAVGLAQVEALGLVEVFDLVRSTGLPHPRRHRNADAKISLISEIRSFKLDADALNYSLFTVH